MGAAPSAPYPQENNSIVITVDGCVDLFTKQLAATLDAKLDAALRPIHQKLDQHDAQLDQMNDNLEAAGTELRRIEDLLGSVHDNEAAKPVDDLFDPIHDRLDAQDTRLSHVHKIAYEHIKMGESMAQNMRAINKSLAEIAAKVERLRLDQKIPFELPHADPKYSKQRTRDARFEQLAQDVGLPKEELMASCDRDWEKRCELNVERNRHIDLDYIRNPGLLDGSHCKARYSGERERQD